MTTNFTHRGDHASVFFSGELTWESAVELVDAVDTLVDWYFYADVELTVDSEGGRTDAFDYVHAAMRRWHDQGARLCTRVVSRASSAAALLVSLGAERVAAPGAQLRYHNVLVREAGSVTAGEARALHGSLTRIDERMAGLLAERALRGAVAQAPVAPGAEPSDRAVLERLAGGRQRSGARRARTEQGAPVEHLAAALGRRVANAVQRKDRAALARLYLNLASMDTSVSAPLARTLRLVDRVDAGAFSPRRGHDASPPPGLRVAQWRALYPPHGEVPLAALTRHTLVLGETGSGKSASAMLPVVAAAARAPRERVGTALVIDPKHELEPVVAALAPQRLHHIVAADVVLDIMAGPRWSLAEDMALERVVSAATKVLRRVVSFVSDVPAKVLEGRPTGRDAYWDLEGTDLLVTALGFVFLLLRANAPDPVQYLPEDQEALDLKLPRFGGHLNTVRRRCPDVEESSALRAGVPASDGRAGARGPHARGAGTRVRVLCASGPQLGAAGRSRRGSSRGRSEHGRAREAARAAAREPPASRGARDPNPTSPTQR